MPDDVFREAVKKTDPVEEKAPETKSPARPVNGEDKEVPIALHQDLTGKPYTAKYYEIETIWDNPDIDMQDDVVAIEEYYKQKVQNGDYEDGKETYKKMINEISKATNSRDSRKEVQIAKIAEWVRFMGRLEKIDRDVKRWNG